MEEALYSEVVTVLLELTGSMTKGAFLRQTFYQFADRMDESMQEMMVVGLADVGQCLDREQLIMECNYKGSFKYGDLRKAVVAKFIKTKYDIKSNNCFNFVIAGFDVLGFNSEYLKKRQGIIEGNVRKHNVIVPTLERALTN